MNIFFAQQQVPWPETAKWLLGFIGFAVACGSVFWTVNEGKRLFRRNPPIEEEFSEKSKGLRSEIYHAKNSVLKEVNAALAVERQRIARLEERDEQMQLNLERRWAQLQNELSGVQRDLAFIRGRFERKDPA